MRRLPLLLVLSCSGGDEPTPPAVPDAPLLPIDQTGAGPVVRLDPFAAALSLPDRAGTTMPTEFDLEDLGADGEFADCWVADLPFTTNRVQERNLPDGIEVFVDGTSVPYVPWAHTHEPGWRITNGQLHVTWTAKPDRVRLAYPNLARRADRYEPSTADLEPGAFVNMTYSAGAASRRGLLLPAPATAGWALTVPAGGRFEAATALAVPPGLEQTSDGAWAVVRFREGDAVTELDRRFVGPPGWLDRQLTSFELKIEDPFTPWVVPLDKVAGRTGTLEIAAEVYGDADQDYLFVGHPAVVSPPAGPPRHVVVIGVDTTRADRLGLYGYDRGLTPELDAFAAASAVFDQAWTPAPRTRPSFRSATTGRYPLAAVGAANIGEVFSENGFATAGIVANVHLNPRFDFHQGFDLWRLDPKATATGQVDLALEWLEAHRHRDTYLFLHLIDPHLFYRPPDAYVDAWVRDPDPNLPPEFNRWAVMVMDRNGELTDRRKKHISDLYDAEIAYTSAELGRFLKGLDGLGGQTLVVLHSDHGEELWDHGGFEHNHTLYDELTKAVLVVRPPGGVTEPVRTEVPATLVDIAPTLYDYLGFGDLPATDGISLRPYIEGRGPEDQAERAIGTAHLMYDREAWGVIYRGHKYTLETGSGDEALYDLAADPEEKANLAATVDLDPWRAALSRAHLDMPVGPGWRLDFVLSDPVTVTLPKPAESVGIIDPEAFRRGRANQAWGEIPPLAPDDVATLALSEDRRTLTITPVQGRGSAWVRFAEPTVVHTAILQIADEPQRLFRRNDTRIYERDGEYVVFHAGTVLEPPVGEAQRMKALSEGVSADDIELLHALGYMGGGEPPSDPH